MHGVKSAHYFTTGCRGMIRGHMVELIALFFPRSDWIERRRGQVLEVSERRRFRAIMLDLGFEEQELGGGGGTR